MAGGMLAPFFCGTAAPGTPPAVQRPGPPSSRTATGVRTIPVLNPLRSSNPRARRANRAASPPRPRHRAASPPRGSPCCRTKSAHIRLEAICAHGPSASLPRACTTNMHRASRALPVLLWSLLVLLPPATHGRAAAAAQELDGGGGGSTSSAAATPDCAGAGGWMSVVDGAADGRFGSVPQLSVAQMAAVAGGLRAVAVRRGAPASLLVFGVGHDSVAWAAANCGGRTAFLEDNEQWRALVTGQHPHLEAVQVVYRGRMSNQDEFFAAPWEPELPANITEACWDAILVDAPAGYDAAAGHPGRMEAAFAALKLAERCVASGRLQAVEIFLHDTGRPLEAKIVRELLLPHPMVQPSGVLSGRRVRHLAGFVVQKQPEAAPAPASAAAAAAADPNPDAAAAPAATAAAVRASSSPAAAVATAGGFMLGAVFGLLVRGGNARRGGGQLQRARVPLLHE